MDNDLRDGRGAGEPGRGGSAAASATEHHVSAVGGQASPRLAGPAPAAGLDDATLVARARDRDVRAFEELVRRYQGAMFGHAVRMLADRAEAEDAVQEVFVTAWRRLSELHADAAFSSWLYRSTTRRCLNVLRSRKPATEFDVGLVAAGPAGQPDRAAVVSAQLEALTAALQRLTPEQRACWLLREVEDLPYEEIAEVVGTTATAVRGRIARARAQLAEVMAPWR